MINVFQIASFNSAFLAKIRNNCFAFMFLFLPCLIFFPFSYAGELELEPQAIKGCSHTVNLPPARTRPATDATKILPPERGIYPGLYNIGSTPTAYEDFTEKTGKAPVFVYTFHDFVDARERDSANPKIRTFTEKLEGDGAPSPLDFAKEISKKGSVLALSWAIECCDFDSIPLWYNITKPNRIVPRILKGDFDAEIRIAAKQIKNLGLPIFLSLFGEYHPPSWFLFGKDGRTQINAADNICNGYGDPGWPDGPERVRDVYRHVIDIFRSEDVKNVTWFMYTSTRYMDSTSDEHTIWMHPKYFYPGDAYIDWVGQSAYFVDSKNRPKVNEEISDINFALKPGYDAWGSVTQRPLFLAEFGASGDGTRSRAKVLREVLKDYLPSLPRVKAFTYADAVLFKEYFELPLLGHFSDELSTWKKVVTNNPYYVSKLRLTGPLAGLKTAITNNPDKQTQRPAAPADTQKFIENANKKPKPEQKSWWKILFSW